MYEEFSRELQLLLNLQQYIRGNYDCTILNTIETQKATKSIDDELEKLISSFKGGLAEICQLLNINQGTLRRKMDKNNPSIEFNLFEVLTLIKASEQYGLLFALANKFNCYCVSIMGADVPDKEEDILFYWSKRERERGDTLELIDLVISDETADCDIFIKICQEMFDDFSHGKILLTHLGEMVH